MNKAVLHYIHDPLCGWCYGAAPLVRAAREVLPVRAHGGGMMAGPNRQPVTPQLRAHVMPHDRRIAQLTGQPFGRDYFDGLLRNESAVFDSAPPIAAVLAARSLEGNDAGLDLLARVQSAHYLSGRIISDEAVLVELAVSSGFDCELFAARLEETLGPVTDAHIAESRALLARVGGRGFPTFVLETDGSMEVLDVGAFFGKPEDWKVHLRQRLGD